MEVLFHGLECFIKNSFFLYIGGFFLLGFLIKY